MPVRSGMTATTRTVSRVNQTAIAETVRVHGPLSRQEISRRTGLSPATVNRLTAALVADGLIVEDGTEPSTGGRPAIRVRYAGRTRAVVAVYVRFDGVAGALVDLDGEVRHREEAHYPQSPADGSADGARTLAATYGVVDRLLAAAEREGLTCVSVGLAVPGVVDQAHGVVVGIPELGWSGLRLGEELRARTDLPATVENDANALAYGELHRGLGRGASSVIALLLDNGFGAGIVTNGELYRGARAAAGEVAFLLTDRAALQRPVSRAGDLEDRIGAAALTREARSRGLDVGEQGLITAQQVFARAQAGEPVAMELADEILDMVALAVAAMVTILDPELIVIGGALTMDAGVIIAGISDRLAGRLLTAPRLETSALGPEGVVLGLAELAAAAVRGYAFVVD